MQYIIQSSIVLKYYTELMSPVTKILKKYSRCRNFEKYNENECEGYFIRLPPVEVPLWGRNKVAFSVLL